MHGLAALVATLRAALPGAGTATAGSVVAEAAAGALRANLPSAQVLTAAQRAGSGGSYDVHLLHVEQDPLFSVTALVWQPGARTALHDHICWGAVGVIQGAESETRFRRGPDDGRLRLTPAGTTRYGAGEVCWFAPPEDIHQVRNPDAEVAISIHIYGADLTGSDGSSIRRTYP